MTLLSVLDILLMIVGGAGMIYQGLCIVMSLFAKPVRFPDAPMTNRYAVLISARNEEKVIGNLIGSIRDQTYPSNSSTSGWWPTTAPTTPPTCAVFGLPCGGTPQS